MKHDEGGMRRREMTLKSQGGGKKEKLDEEKNEKEKVRRRVPAGCQEAEEQAGERGREGVRRRRG
jgi:hypothetical protein